MGIQAVRNNANYGIYVWMMDNGKPFSDGKGNVLNLPGRPLDIEAMAKVRDAARHYGAPKGEVKFLAGTQRVSEMRASEEMSRFKEGHIPSETDIGAWADAQRAYEEAKAKGYDYDR